MFPIEDGSPHEPPPPQETRPRAGRRAGGGAAAPAQGSAEEENEEPKQEASPSPPEDPEPGQPGQQEEQQEENPLPRKSSFDDSDDNDLAPPAPSSQPPPPQPPPSQPQQSEEGNARDEDGDGGGKESISTPPAPAPPRIQGRRAGNPSVGGFMGASAAPPADGEQENRAADPLAAPGEGTNKQLTGVSKRKQEQHAQLAEQKVKAKSKYDERALDAEVLDIPELEEEGKEDLSRLVAEAPKVRTNKVQGIMELDEDMQYMLPAAGDKDIDLSMLTAVLASSEQVDERDDIWTPETLLVQLASELNSEMEKAEGRKEAAVSKS